MKATVSILIVAYKSRETLPEVMAALGRQTALPGEVLVLENGSPDGERVRPGDLPEWARLIESETNLGFAGGNNLLAREAVGDWLVLLNPDAFPEPDWLEQMLEGAKRWPGATIFGCTQTAHGSPGVLDGAGDVYHASGLPYRGGYGRKMAPPPDGEVFAACGAALMIRRDLFEQLGGFDEDYFCYVEDVDLCFRARLMGHAVIQLQAPAVSHVGYASSGRRSEFATYQGARNRFWTFFKNVPGWLLPVLTPLHLAATLALWISATRFGQFTLFAKAIRDALAGWPELMKKRREVQGRRTVPVMKIARQMAWNPLLLLTRAPVVRPASGENRKS